MNTAVSICPHDQQFADKNSLGEPIDNVDCRRNNDSLPLYIVSILSTNPRDRWHLALKKLGNTTILCDPNGFIDRSQSIDRRHRRAGFFLSVPCLFLSIDFSISSWIRKSIEQYYFSDWWGGALLSMDLSIQQLYYCLQAATHYACRWFKTQSCSALCSQLKLLVLCNNNSHSNEICGGTTLCPAVQAVVQANSQEYECFL